MTRQYALLNYVKYRNDWFTVFCLKSDELQFLNFLSANEVAVLYGCETWSLTLREERKLRVFENKVLRIFGPRRDEVTGDWRSCITRS